MVLLVLLAGSGAAVGPAAGGSPGRVMSVTPTASTATPTAPPTSTATATATPTATPTGPPGAVRTSNQQTLAPNATYVAQVDPALRIVSYSADDGHLSITFVADVPKVVTLSAVGDGSGATKVTIKRVPLPRGRTTVRFSSTTVVITTRASLERNQAVRIEAGGSGVNPVRSLTSGQSLVVGAAVALGWVVVAGWRELHKERQEPMEAVA